MANIAEIKNSSRWFISTKHGLGWLICWSGGSSNGLLKANIFDNAMFMLLDLLAFVCGNKQG